MTPWKQTWRQGTGEGGEHRLGVYDSDGKCVVYTPEPAERRFIAAAPDMARVLLGMMRQTVGGVRHTDECMVANTLDCLPSCIAARAALEKAGVLP